MVEAREGFLNVLDGAVERTTWWRLPGLGTPELLHASFRTRTFSRHAHDRFAFGVIEAGGLAFRYRGQDVVAPAGWVNLAFPGEVHCGHGVGPEGWSYRMFYLDPAHMLTMAQALDPSLRELPFVPAGAVWDPWLARRISQLHRHCLDPAGDALERQSALAILVQRILCRHGALHPKALATRAGRAIQMVRQVLEDRADQLVTLEELARLAGMNPYGLVRQFTREYGLPPHAYLVQVRVNRAASLLREGKPPAQVAAECGFSDQSHLNRHFLRHFGVTPGVYRRARSERRRS